MKNNNWCERRLSKYPNKERQGVWVLFFVTKFLQKNPLLIGSNKRFILIISKTKEQFADYIR